ncbi:MAG: ribose 5-phosphate isomerase B [Chloroflexota bacterium]
MRIAVGSDHRGVELKRHVTALLKELGHSYHDFGGHTSEPVDYPDVAREVGRAVATGEFERGILICGTGLGMSIAANKIPGIRAALCGDVHAARRSREHNDANVLCLSGETPRDRARDIVSEYLSSRFEGGRHLSRVEKIKALEQECR